MNAITAAAHPNLALVKYWGKRDKTLNIPTNNSISVNLSGATTTTTVHFDSCLAQDQVTINGLPAGPEASSRVSRHLDWVRNLAKLDTRARVTSDNDFPTAAGIASSASAFAALSLAASQATGLTLDARELSILARKGSGSACRSLHDGFVEWFAGDCDETSYADQLAPSDHWDLQIITVVLDTKPKSYSSGAGHQAALTSPFFQARLEMLPRTLVTVREALLGCDFARLAQAVEREAVSMHAVAITSCVENSEWLSGLYYWGPATCRLIHAVQEWRQHGLDVCFTIDAGPNVHLLCEQRNLAALQKALAPLCAELNASSILSQPGRGAWLLD